MKFNRIQFGGKASKEDLERYSRSPHWKNGRFENFQKVNLSLNPFDLPKIIYKQIKGREESVPDMHLNLKRFDKNHFEDREIQFCWFGHSTLAIRMAGKNILIDPQFGHDASPIGPFRTRRFVWDTMSVIEDLPEIDLVLITHDHYDHLDYDSIQALKRKVKAFYVGLGVKRHLLAWGIDPEIITEFDWWDKTPLADIIITYTPTRHFSGRGLTDRQKSLWGGWLLDDGSSKVWFSGDGGYGDHFKEIGKQIGPIDIAFMECGQYNDDWNDVHLFPEESVKAAIDVNAGLAVPVHWGGFNLSYQHSWYEPAEDFMAFAKSYGLNYNVPQLGEIFNLEDKAQGAWWKPIDSSVSI